MNNTIKKEKRWIVKATDDAKAKACVSKIANALKLHPIIANLLYTRGYTDVKSARAFLRMESEMLANPFEMKDMERGVDRIREAIAKKEKITIYGDYDVDGVTSVCVLYLYIKSKGGIVDYHIPNRSGEGYGVSKSAIDTVKENGTSLIITVDTGITANEEIEYAKGLGIDFVVTDHHECCESLPSAAAVINPHRPDCKYPFKELAGVGVVFKVISAYEERVFKKTRREAALYVFSQYADLVAIGTIADVMPIKSENRIIVSYGLGMIENTSRPGIVALIDAASTKEHGQRSDNTKKHKITSSYIGYTLAPRINAAGRIKSATIAVDLFLSDNMNDATAIAETLCKANKERQAEENNIMKDVYEKIETIDIDDTPVIVLSADNWHHGVIGIVASRITEKYSRPTILVSFDGNDESLAYSENIGKGSGRSVKGLNLVDALSHCSDYLVKYGGHELAAGLSVTRANLDTFIAEINKYAKENLKEEDMIPLLEADCEISFSDTNLYVAEQLRQLEPYGVGNPVPTFVTRGVYVNEISPVSDGKHTKLVLSDGNKNITAMFFSNSPDSLGISVGDMVDVLFNIDINEWFGRRSVQLIVKDIKISVSAILSTRRDRARFSEIWGGAEYSEDENVLPTRDDFAAVYRFLHEAYHMGINTLTHRELVSRLSKSQHAAGRNIGYIKLKMIIRVFQELNVLGIDEFEEEKYKFVFKYTNKTHLEKSTILRRLRNQQKR